MSDDDKYEDTESDADKRAYHNLLERKRRDHIKDGYSSLRDVIPAFKRGRVRASRAQILKKTAEFIRTTRQKNAARRAEIEEIINENLLLEEHVRILQNALDTGNYEEAHKVIALRANITLHIHRESCSYSDSDSESESDWDNDDSSDSDEEHQDRRKRIKLSRKTVKRSFKKKSVAY